MLGLSLWASMTRLPSTRRFFIPKVGLQFVVYSTQGILLDSPFGIIKGVPVEFISPNELMLLPEPSESGKVRKGGENVKADYFLHIIYLVRIERLQSLMPKARLESLPGRTGLIPKDWLNRGGGHQVRLKQ